MINETIDTETSVPASQELAVSFTDESVAQYKDQRSNLVRFVRSELVEKEDFGVIPGTGNKPTLLKPGAEKLAKLFGLGSQIRESKHEMDLEKGWAWFCYTVSLVHLKTGVVVAQCEGSANSKEKKYASRPAPEMINTLQKMAQKRAYVGAVMIATGASTYFTQDVEDMDTGNAGKSSGAQQSRSDAPCELCHAELVLSKSGEWYYCPNFKDESKGSHTKVKKLELAAYKDYLASNVRNLK